VSEQFDLLVVGGGINGVGIARDAAGRGLKVLLCEKGDLAGATSSASSKLIHGGLRYLEHGGFRLVREGLAEREVLLRMAPHLVRPLNFVLPQGEGSRPAWLIRAGLFLYDRLGGGRSLPGSRSVKFTPDNLGAPLREGVRSGFMYSDCRTDDARLTIANARDAALRGAEILSRTALVSARRESAHWRAILSTDTGDPREITARILVNAAGPWVLDVLARAGLFARFTLRLVKGSHIVVPRLYEGKHAYLLQNEDRRIVFVIPFERDFSLIGTTELPFDGDPARAEITDEEIAYLCRAVGRWFSAPPSPADVIWNFAGVRPLYDDRARSASAVTRDYAFDVDTAGAPALSVFGGKLTTYRRLAEHVLERLEAYLPAAGLPWTANSILPGGEDFDPNTVTVLWRQYPFLGEATADRLARSYGSEAHEVLGGTPGDDLGHGLYEAELRWLIDKEWARTAEDVLWCRTKLGLRFTPAEARALGDYVNRLPRSAPAPADAASLPAGQTAYR
jgi:glycerol-3-phosphate dehydrogenase